MSGTCGTNMKLKTYPRQKEKPMADEQECTLFPAYEPCSDASCCATEGYAKADGPHQYCHNGQIYVVTSLTDEKNCDDPFTGDKKDPATWTVQSFGSWITNSSTETVTAIFGDVFTDGKLDCEKLITECGLATKGELAAVKPTIGDDGQWYIGGIATGYYASNYYLWLAQGNTGSEADYLASLAGGDGTAGSDGASAYDIWLAAGNTGTEQEFLDSLQGADGDDGSGASYTFASPLTLSSSGEVGIDCDALKAGCGLSGGTTEEIEPFDETAGMGNVGSYIHASFTDGTSKANYGDIVAGSSLVPSGHAGFVANSNTDADGITRHNSGGILLESSNPLAGSWRAMGNASQSADVSVISTLWLRVA